MPKSTARTIQGRRELWRAFCKKLDVWLVMSDEELLQEVKKGFPIITTATRNECLKRLIADETSKLIGE